MNTNSNVYTVVYTTLVCVLVAAILAFVSQVLGPRQADNVKAETIGQILTAARFGEKSEWEAKGNAAILEFYKENAAEAILVNAAGDKVGELDIASASIVGQSGLKAANYGVKDGSDYTIPVYVFKNGVSVLAIYGAGLWGPVWGYVALRDGVIEGAYFDHASETPGLGGKIKDDPSFRAQFCGKSFDLSGEGRIFSIVKGGAPEGATNAIDAISGATMTSRGVDEAVNLWVGAYKNYLSKQQ